VDDDGSGSHKTPFARPDGAAMPADPAAAQAAAPAAAPAAPAKSRRYRIAAAIMRATSAARSSAARSAGHAADAWRTSPGPKLAAAIAHKGVRYWIGTLIFLAASWWLSQQLYKVRDVSVRRAYYFQWLFEHGPRAAYPKYVRLELIDDHTYNKSKEGNSPISDEMLVARLVAQLAQPDVHANVIAIDFGFEAPRQAPTADDCALAESIHNAVARESRVVLPVVVLLDKANDRLYRAPDIYQAFGLCPAEQPVKPAQCGPPYHTTFDDKERSRISCGYWALPADFSRIPTQWHIGDDQTLESFALAIARATEPKITENLIASFHDELPIGHFLRVDAFGLVGHEFAADSYPRDEINGATVIIGGAWHKIGENQGPLIDLHDTPADKMVGAMLHANYVEALLDQRTASALSERGAQWLEIAFAVAAVFAFASFPGWRGLGALLPLIGLMLAAQWIVLHTFGVYFDVLIVLLGLAIHSFLEHLFGSHGHAPPRPDPPESEPAAQQEG